MFSCKGFTRSFATAMATLCISATGSAATFEWASVGNPGNTPDPLTGYGAVPYTFSIGTYDVTVSQYVEFLNAKDPFGTNALNLYSPKMSGTVGLLGDTYGGIDFKASNTAGAKYNAKLGQQKRPATMITFFRAVRFANWVHNGQGSGDTETGAYTLGALNADGSPINNRVTRNAGAQVWLPSDNEWYKAAYHGNTDSSSSGYFKYPTSNNKQPTAGFPSPLPNNVNASPIGGASVLLLNTTDVGAYSGTTSPYGAYDMGGNVFQWTDTIFEPTSLYPLGRVIRGGSFAGSQNDLLSTTRFSGPVVITATTQEWLNQGFRLASNFPGVVAPPLPPPSPALNSIEVKIAGGKGVIKSPDGTIDCGAVCKATVAAGTIITLTVTPDTGFKFVNWTGACSGVSPNCTVKITGKVSAQANLTK